MDKTYFAFLAARQQRALHRIADAFHAAASTGGPGFIRLSDTFDRIMGAFHQPVCTSEIAELNGQRIATCLKATTRLLTEALNTAAGNPAGRKTAKILRKKLSVAARLLDPSFSPEIARALKAN